MSRRHLFGLTGIVMLTALAAPVGAQTPAPAPAPAPPPGPAYVIAFFETGASAAVKTGGMLGPYIAATRKENGNEGAVALREIARPGRFALVEVWHDRAAVDAHMAAMTALQDKLAPVLASPFDIRRNGGLSVSGPAIGSDSGAPIYVLTHVDVFPAGKDQAIDMLKQLAEASRKEPGNVRFDVLQQDGRLNHLPLIEAWQNAGARDGHAIAEPTRSFREKLVKLQGALYDERLYTPIR